MTKNGSTEPLVIERVFEADAAEIWKALTAPSDLRRWSFLVADFKPEAAAIDEKPGGHKNVPRRRRPFPQPWWSSWLVADRNVRAPII